MALRRDCSFPLFVFGPGSEQVTGKYSDFLLICILAKPADTLNRHRVPVFSASQVLIRD